MEFKRENLDVLLQAFPQEFLALSPDQQRISLHLYRLLAKGEPVATADLAAGLGLSEAVVNGILDGWPGVYYDEDRRVIGYWGLTLPETDHRFEVDGKRLFTWCAWDSLFLPELLQQTAHVESLCPTTGEKIGLTITPHGIEHRQPAGTVMSFVKPDAARVRQEWILNFCHYVYFFTSADEATRWVSKHPGTSVLSLEAAHELGRKKNRAQYHDVLNDPLPATTSRSVDQG